MEPFNDAFFGAQESPVNDEQTRSETIPNTDILQDFDFTAFLNGGQETDCLAWDEEELSLIDYRDKIPYDQDFLEPLPPQVEGLGVSFNEEDVAAETQVAVADEATRTQAQSIAVSISASGLQTPYQNCVLNDFDDPEVPLRIIDRLSYPFSREIEAALAQELTPREQEALNHIDRALEAENQRRERASKPTNHELTSNPQVEDLSQDLGDHRDLKLEFGSAAGLEAQRGSFLGVPQQTPASLLSGASTPGRRTPKNRRSANIAENDPERFYNHLTKCPESWEGKDPMSERRTLFEYTNHGELKTREFSGEEFCAYFSDHPLHTINGKKNSLKSNLLIWIQSTPADSTHRYPTALSSKCRFEMCPDTNRTIRNGEYRLAFDEQSWKNENFSPFCVAGYVHLYCMEKNFNFRQFCTRFNVHPDCRQLPEGTNKMAITRDHQSMRQICLDFMDSPQDSAHQKSDLNYDWFERSLTRQLTVEHTRKQSSHVQKQRQKRGGLNLDTHHGNLDKLALLKEERRKQKAAVIKQEPSLAPTARLQKRCKSRDYRSEESGLDDILEREDIKPRPSQKRRLEY